MTGSPLFEIFCRSAFLHKDFPAVVEGDREISYADLAELVGAISLSCKFLLGSQRLIGVFVRQDIVGYASILAALSLGAGYVPLDPQYPSERLAKMIADVDLDLIVGDARLAQKLAIVMERAHRSIQIIQVEENIKEIRSPDISFSTAGNADAPHACNNTALPGDAAYVLFTSGTTGRPKGVAIGATNVLSYLEQIRQFVALRPGDKASQLFGLSFDLSVHDLFVTWGAGATIVAPSPADLVSPRRYVTRNALTSFFCVPTVAAATLPNIGENSLSSLRYSLFCGEPLTASVAMEWSRAASNSEILNLYGPTEATIAISAFRWSKAAHEPSRNGIVSLGRIFDNHLYRIVEDDEDAGRGEPGELWLSGPQVARGYLNRAKETEQSFVKDVNDPARVWYRTGDIVSEKPDRSLDYHGRRDDQLKIAGFRIEMSEVEFFLRRAAGSDLAAVGCRRNERGMPIALVALLPESCRPNLANIDRLLTEQLPKYMVPSQFLFVDELPRNSRGKIDRGEIEALCNRWRTR